MGLFDRGYHEPPDIFTYGPFTCISIEINKIYGKIKENFLKFFQKYPPPPLATSQFFKRASPNNLTSSLVLVRFESSKGLNFDILKLFFISLTRLDYIPMLRLCFKFNRYDCSELNVLNFCSEFLNVLKCR